jgi:hypothetical protein
MNLIRNTALTTLVLIIIGTLFSKYPFVQYLGNTTGVFLGFVLAVWWQEIEKQRSKKKRDDAFWKDFKIFLPGFEDKVRLQKSTTSNFVEDNIFEYRLPLPELIYFYKEANELGLDSKLRRQISEMVQHTKIIEEYIDLGADRINGKWRSNFQSLQERLYSLVLEIKNSTAVHS